MTDSADRGRSEILAMATPRGRIDVMCQQMRGLEKSRGWQLFWLARRAGTQNWVEATTPQEAIRKAALVSAGKPPTWLRQAASEALRQLTDRGEPPAEADGDPPCDRCGDRTPAGPDPMRR